MRRGALPEQGDAQAGIALSLRAVPEGEWRQIINTRHGGQMSRLRKGLCEAVDQLLAKPLHGRQVAVVPYTKSAFDPATQLAPRCADAGIELALVVVARL